MANRIILTDSIIINIQHDSEIIIMANPNIILIYMYCNILYCILNSRLDLNTNNFWSSFENYFALFSYYAF